MTRYGNTRIFKIHDAIKELREACRSEGTPRIQSALDRLEPWIDYVYQEDDNDLDVGANR